MGHTLTLASSLPRNSPNPGTGCMVAFPTICWSHGGESGEGILLTEGWNDVHCCSPLRLHCSFCIAGSRTGDRGTLGTTLAPFYGALVLRTNALPLPPASAVGSTVAHGRHSSRRVPNRGILCFELVGHRGDAPQTCGSCLLRIDDSALCSNDEA